MNCIICDSELIGRQTKYCSNRCKCKDFNNRFQNYKSQRKRAIERKIKYVALLGGCCCVCGYDSNFAALSFHHKDPSIKKFKLDLRSLGNRSEKSILVEVEKCVVLCANCHLEHHNPDMGKDIMLDKWAHSESNGDCDML